MSNEHKSDDDMTPDERLAWLRERGVQVETPAERKASQIANAMKEAESLSSSTLTSDVSFVLLPADTSKPLRELTTKCPDNWKEGDYLVHHLKPFFKAKSDDYVDLSLLQQHGTQTLAGSDVPAVSGAALKKVAQEANVETFSLVHPCESNKYTGIQVYLDEIGMLKRLPLNTRAMEFAKRAGYDPAPQFYGDVFFGRIRKFGSMTKNQSFVLGPDTDPAAPWILAAATDNLQYQIEINRMTGRHNETQPSVEGADGKAKEEESFSWTQTEEELEVSVVLPTGATSKQVQVKFKPQSLHVTCQGEVKVALQLFERVDVDGCTWTKDGDKLLISMEKIEAAFWPRIKD